MKKGWQVMKKMSFERCLTVLLTMCMLLGLFVGCKKSSAEISSARGESDQASAADSADVSGAESAASSDLPASSINSKQPSAGNPNSKKYSVSVGFSAAEKPEFDKLIPVFQKKFPNITVKPQQIDTSLYNITPKWTALASAGKMPDVIIGSENFGYIMQQGWAYPLDKLLAADSDKTDVLETGLPRYTYNGRLYALPYRMQFNGLVLNVDLLNELNLKKPSYDWTIDEFVSLAKKATTDKYSGINILDAVSSESPTRGMDVKLMNAMLPSGYEQFGYSISTHKFDLKQNNAWVTSQNLIKELKSEKGLVADELKNWDLRNQGKMDDYDKKFGKNADAYVSGKVLFGNSDSWRLSWWKSFKFKYDFYPIPTQKGISQRLQTHVDFVFMSSAVPEDRAEAAFKLVRFLSYDKDGCATRLQVSMDRYNNADAVFELYVPATTNRDIIAQFNKTPFPAGLKYMYEQVVKKPKQTLVADTDKIVPDFWLSLEQYRKQASEKISAGTQPAALVNDLNTKVNNTMASTWKFLDKKLADNLEKFLKTHPSAR